MRQAGKEGGAQPAGGLLEEDHDWPANLHIEMVKNALQWLSSLCEHGDSVKELISSALLDSALLVDLVRLRAENDTKLSSDSTMEPQPLIDLDNLVFPLLLFSHFKEGLLGQMLQLYHTFSRLSPPPPLDSPPTSPPVSWPPAVLPADDATSKPSSRFLEAFTVQLLTCRALADFLCESGALQRVMHSFGAMLSLSLAPARTAFIPVQKDSRTDRDPHDENEGEEDEDGDDDGDEDDRLVVDDDVEGFEAAAARISELMDNSEVRGRRSFTVRGDRAVAEFMRQTELRQSERAAQMMTDHTEARLPIEHAPGIVGHGEGQPSDRDGGGGSGSDPLPLLADVEEEERGGRVVNASHLMVASKRYMHIAQDLRYTLSHTRIAEQLLRRPVATGEPWLFEWWLHTCEWMQHMCPLQRDPHEQPRDEDEMPWIQAFVLDLEVGGLLPLMLVPLNGGPDSAADWLPMMHDCARTAWVRLLGWLTRTNSALVDAIDEAAPAVAEDNPAEGAGVPAAGGEGQGTHATSSGAAPVGPSAATASAASASAATAAAAAAAVDCLQGPSEASVSTGSAPPTLGSSAEAAAAPQWTVTPAEEVGMRPEWRTEKQFPQLLSHHLPLHRSLAAFLQVALQRQDESTLQLLQLTAEQAIMLSDHPLRLQLLPLQLRQRWWSGNGREAWAADRFYRSRLYREAGWSMDMLVVQVCATVLGPSSFIRHILQRAGVANPSTSPEATPPTALEPSSAAAAAPFVATSSGVVDAACPTVVQSFDGSATSQAAKQMGLTSPHAPSVAGEEVCPLGDIEQAQLEEVLGLLVLTLKGWATPDDVSMRQALLHQLALGPLPHSVLAKRVEPRWADHPKFDALLHELGKSVEGDGASGAGGKYVLKGALWVEVDPSHAFFAPEEAAQVAQRLSTRRQQRPSDGGASTPKGITNKGLDAHEPAMPPPWVSACGLSYLPSLSELLHSDALLALVCSALATLISGAGGAETLLAHTLQLLGHGIQLAPAGATESVLRSIRKTVSASEAKSASKVLNPTKQSSSSGGLTSSGKRFLDRLCDLELLTLDRRLAPAGSATKPLSLIGALLKLQPSLPPMQSAAVERMLDLATASSPKCSQHLHMVRTSLAEAEAAAASTTKSPQAERERRRAAAKAERARLMKSMQEKQAAFEGAQEPVCEEAKPQEVLTPRAHAKQRAHRCDSQGLRRLLGDEDVMCVLCKEPLIPSDMSEEIPPIGFIARACRQRLPQASQVDPSRGCRAHREAAPAARACAACCHATSGQPVLRPASPLSLG